MNANRREKYGKPLITLMKENKPISDELIAPCGMNCAICSRYLSYLNNLNKPKCSGCIPENKKCSYLFEKCNGINNSLNGNASAKFCFECKQYSSCREIIRMDERYKNNYKMSVKKNLSDIQKRGVDKFIEEQYKKYNCSNCGGLVSIHNRKCFKCEEVTKLVEKLIEE